MQAWNKGDEDDDDDSNPALPPLDEIDWDAMMRNFSPPEWDLLLSATAKNDIVQVRDLVENQGVPVTHQNGIGQTALHIAALWGHVNVVRYLVEKGANVDAANQLTGATPLHCALSSHRISSEQQAAIANVLVQQGGADPLLEDKAGKAPIEYVDKKDRQNHPLFVQPHYAALLAKLTPAPPGVERLRAGFLRNILQDKPMCAAIPRHRQSNIA